MRYKVYISFDDIKNLVDVIAKKVLEELPNIDSITGIERGGLIPAVMLSHKLNLPYVKAIQPNTLVVDDICDSGVTIRDTVGVYTATLYTKESAVVQPTIYGTKLLNEAQWLVFPWENEDAEPIQDYLK